MVSRERLFEQAQRRYGLIDHLTHSPHLQGALADYLSYLKSYSKEPFDNKTNAQFDTINQKIQEKSQKSPKYKKEIQALFTEGIHIYQQTKGAPRPVRYAALITHFSEYEQGVKAAQKLAAINRKALRKRG